MIFIKYGGIQQYGQLLYGWMKYGVLGTETEVVVTPDARGRLPKPPKRKIYVDQDFMDILSMLTGSGLI